MLRNKSTYQIVFSELFILILLTNIMIAGCRPENDMSGKQTPVVGYMQLTQTPQSKTTPIPSATVVVSSPSQPPVVATDTSLPEIITPVPTQIPTPTPSFQINRIFNFGGKRLAISPDRSQIAVSLDGENIDLYSYETGQHQRVLVKPTAPYYRPSYAILVFSPDSKWLAVGGLEKTVWIWDVDSGALVSEFPFVGPVSDLAFSSNGQLVAVVSASENIGEHGISVFDSNTGALVVQIVEGVVARDVVFLKNKAQLLIGIELDYRPGVARQNGFMIWNYGVNEMPQVLSQYDAPDDIAIDAEGKRLAATIAGKLHLINLQTFTEIDVEKPEIRSRNLKFDDAGNIFALHGDVLFQWDANGKFLRQQQFVEATDFAVIPKTNHLLILFPEEIWEVAFQ